MMDSGSCQAQNTAINARSSPGLDLVSPLSHLGTQHGFCVIEERQGLEVPTFNDNDERGISSYKFNPSKIS